MCLQDPEWYLEKIGEGLTQSYDKSPYTHRKPKKKNTPAWQHTNAIKNFDNEGTLERSFGVTIATQLV